MCNAAKHSSGCECGFGPPYPGKIELVEVEEWVDEATSSEKSFRRALEALNFKTPTFNSFIQEYRSIQHLREPEATTRERLKNLVSQLEYREEDSKHVPVQVPLFRLHSPLVKKAKVTYRESDLPEQKKGWLVKFFGIGMGSTKTFKVVYEPDYISEKGECLQIFVPLVLHIRSIGVYNKSGVLQNRGIRAEIEGIKDEITLRRRGCNSVSPDKCEKGLTGELNTRDYTLAGHSKTKLEKFKLNMPFNIARNVEMRFVEIFGKSFNALATVKHERQLDLEFILPGSHDYRLNYNSAGLRWEVR